ncbi:MAG: hypothetical protein K5872_10440 [Rhizobiaceae bacterium]|nr:hypothetical protein [Rhizobiaceae bacterium]MCV0406634.1 hypothetical protein [Rhizobiaceae bacterium]
MASVPDISAIAAELGRSGLITRGGFNFGPGDPAPDGPRGRPARSVLLVGQAGAAPWAHFTEWLAVQGGEVTDLLDTWSRTVIGAVAERHGARAVSPSDRPFLPFQQWAMRAENLRPSPLGILMHPDYGLWQAYRGALLFDAWLPDEEPHAPNHLCDACASRPCLSACPADAFSDTGFDFAACLAHLRSEAGRTCREAGCQARNACPQDSFRYLPEQQAFHMAAFIDAAATPQ